MSLTFTLPKQVELISHGRYSSSLNRIQKTPVRHEITFVFQLFPFEQKPLQPRLDPKYQFDYSTKLFHFHGLCHIERLQFPCHSHLDFHFELLLGCDLKKAVKAHL